MKNRIRAFVTVALICANILTLPTAAMVIRTQIVGLDLIESAAVEKGETLPLTANFLLSDQNASPEAAEKVTEGVSVVWTSSNDNIAVVDENGLVTATGAGTADIIATLDNGISASCHLKVMVSAEGIKAPEALDLTVNLEGEGSKPLDAAPMPSDATDIKLVYSSSDETIATVDQNGMVTGVGSGECVITSAVVSLEDPERYDFTAETMVTVKMAPESLALSDTSLTIGNSGSLGVVTVPESVDLGKSFTWVSSDKSVVSVDEAGTVKGVSIGSATITATNELGQSASCIVTVKPIVCSYCGANGHTSGYCSKKAVANGAVGRWIIPSVGVNVASYYSRKQATCDAWDSACYFSYGSQMIIADHWNQGFNPIKQCKVGTKAYMDTGDGRTEYVCTGIIQGHNTYEYGLTDLDYNDIEDMNPGGITCYTCNDHWTNITIVFFQPVG